MSERARVALLTGDGLRHRFAASRLAEHLMLAGIVAEGKAPLLQSPESVSAEDRLVIDRHFSERDDIERRFFGEIGSFPDAELLQLPHGSINSPAVFDWVTALNPQFVILYGTSIVKPPLLTAFEGRMINLHLGLSPYYRGSGTNFWPLVYGEPECVGATIHLAVQSVDAGAVLAQIRPQAEVSDRVHELGTRTIIAGFDLMPRIVTLYAEGRITPKPQELSAGRVFRRKDFNADVTRQAWRNFDAGMMADYLRDADRRRSRYPIIELREEAS
jgi:hypothetical protein